MAYAELERQTPPEIGPLYGSHLIINADGCDSRRLTRKKFLVEFLHKLPDILEMQKITEPTVYFRRIPKSPTDSGYSGFVMIAESHISLHTFPKRELLWVDIFSCKPFNVEKVIAETREVFKPQEVNLQMLDRSSNNTPTAT